MIEDYEPTVLIATPSYALYMCEVGEEKGFDWEKSSLRVGLFGGEPCSPHVKEEIEARMHITCTDNYGLTEVMGPGVSGECLASRDMQHIAEDHFIWEVIDPESGEVLPEGEEGELVLTPLDRQALPVLRYRTRDLTHICTDKCECGRTLARMQKVRSRSDDMLIVRGTNVYPSTIQDALANMEELSPHFRIDLDNDAGMDRMVVSVELNPEYFSDSFQDLNNIRKRVEEDLSNTLLLRPEVKLVEPGGIERTQGKAKYVFDQRK